MVKKYLQNVLIRQDLVTDNQEKLEISIELLTVTR